MPHDLTVAVSLLVAVGAWQVFKRETRREGSEATTVRGEGAQTRSTIALMVRPPRENVLFLDFDGVLHPGCSESFVHLPALQQLLRQFPTIDVIISSSWRETARFEYLHMLFAPDLKERVVGITPTLAGTCAREREIIQVVMTHGIRQWIAVDDSADLFSPGWPHLLRTDSSEGLSREKLKALRDVFTSWAAGDELNRPGFSRHF